MFRLFWCLGQQGGACDNDQVNTLEHTNPNHFESLRSTDGGIERKDTESGARLVEQRVGVLF